MVERHFCYDNCVFSWGRLQTTRYATCRTAMSSRLPIASPCRRLSPKIFFYWIHGTFFPTGLKLKFTFFCRKSMECRLKKKSVPFHPGRDSQIPHFPPSTIVTLSGFSFQEWSWRTVICTTKCRRCARLGRLHQRTWSCTPFPSITCTASWMRFFVRSMWAPS